MRKVIRVLKTPVTMLVLLAILGYGAYWGYKATTTDTTTHEVTCVMQDVGPNLTPDKVSVRVLNGGEKPRAAKDTRFYLLTSGFVVISYNNSDRTVPTTTIIGNATTDPEVQLVAKMFQGAVLEGDGRSSHVVDVIVATRPGWFPNPPKVSLPVKGQVCLPVIDAAVKASASADASSAAPTPSATPTPTKKK